MKTVGTLTVSVNKKFAAEKISQPKSKTPK